MQPPTEGIEFERVGPVVRVLRTVLIHPIANYAPAGLIRWLLRVTGSELAAANWADPGGWRSMVISYEGQCRQWADKLLVGTGAVPMALRNRRKLAARVLAELIDACPHSPAQVLCVGAGPGMIIFDALRQASRPARRDADRPQRRRPRVCAGSPPGARPGRPRAIHHRRRPTDRPAPRRARGHRQDDRHLRVPQPTSRSSRWPGSWRP